MDPAEILTLAVDAETYDSIVVLWVTPRGTQPVLMPRSLGRPRSAAVAPATTVADGQARSGGPEQLPAED